MTNPFSLEGKTVFVTGASSGIGRATAIECSKMGATLVITGRNKERLDETMNSLEGSGHSVFVADLSEQEKLSNIAENLPKLDGVVLNAGVTIMLPAQFITEKKLDAVMKINTYAPVLLSAALLKKKKIAKGGSVVFTASIGGYKTASPGLAIYGTTKSALVGYAKCLALEVASKNIRVNTVCPSMIQTAVCKDSEISEEQFIEDAKNYPLKRYGKPEEVAWGIIYLLSGAASFVTGTNLIIDGGVIIK